MFSDRGVKMLVKCLQICAHVFIDRPQNCAQTSFRSRAGLRPNFGHSRSKLCPIMCRLRTKLCPNFGRSRARSCPIYFAPCPFPNLAGTLGMTVVLFTIAGMQLLNLPSLPLPASGLVSTPHTPFNADFIVF